MRSWVIRLGHIAAVRVSSIGAIPEFFCRASGHAPTGVLIDWRIVPILLATASLLLACGSSLVCAAPLKVGTCVIAGLIARYVVDPFIAQAHTNLPVFEDPAMRNIETHDILFCRRLIVFVLGGFGRADCSNFPGCGACMGIVTRVSWT